MELVYFNEELNERAPSMMGTLLIKETDQWATLADVVAALRQGEPVNIRQATPTEYEFAEEGVALYEIWQEIALRRQQLFINMMAYADGVNPEVAAARLADVQGV